MNKEKLQTELFSLASEYINDIYNFKNIKIIYGLWKNYLDKCVADGDIYSYNIYEDPDTLSSGKIFITDNTWNREYYSFDFVIGKSGKNFN